MGLGHGTQDVSSWDGQDETGKALLDSLKDKEPCKSISGDGSRSACHQMCSDDVMPVAGTGQVKGGNTRLLRNLPK